MLWEHSPPTRLGGKQWSLSTLGMVVKLVPKEECGIHLQNVLLILFKRKDNPKLKITNGRVLGSSPSRIQGNPQDERRWRERHVGLALIGPSLRGRERERKKERDQTRNMQQSLEVALFFTIAFNTLHCYISKGQISIQTQFNITSACPSRNQVCSVHFCLWASFPIDFLYIIFWPWG